MQPVALAARALVRRWSRDPGPARQLRFRLVGELLDAVEPAPRDVLDAGCGDASLSERLARAHPEWRIVAVDADPGLLAHARARLGRAGIANVELRLEDVTGPLGSDAYDAVVSVEALEEIEDDAAAIRSLAESVRPGGALLLHVPERDWKPVLPGSDPIWRHEVRHGYGADEIRRKLTENGLVVDQVIATSRGTVRLVQDVVDRIRPRSPAARALVYPLGALAVALERRGLTWGSPRALLVSARRPA